MTADVLVVGSGLMGAAVARCLRDADPTVSIVMLDGGPTIGSLPGQHLHDVPERDLWERWNQRVSSGIQGFYTGAQLSAPTPDAGATLADVQPGMYHLSSLGEDSAAMPAAAVSWNVGGMGVHWTAATPAPWGEEVPAFLAGPQWDADLARAADLLRSNDCPMPPTDAGLAVARALGPLLDPVSAPGRGLRAMPMALVRDDGVGRRTGPNVVFPPIRDPGLDRPRGSGSFTLLTRTMAVRLLVGRGGRVTGARVRDTATGRERDLTAGVTVVCGDAVRTPQLLFASGVRPAALGTHLNEHAFLTGRVLADPGRVGFDVSAQPVLPVHAPTEWFSDHWWLPHSGTAQPFHGQIAGVVHHDDDLHPIAYSVTLALYVPTQVRAENRLAFSAEHTDAAGMPRITVEFSWSDQDRALIAQARERQAALASALGPFDPATESALLPAGSSLHLTGTVRAGERDDGTSVCDPDGRVWGHEDLFVAGTGVVPTALACNATLTGAVTAVRAARAALAAGR